MASAQFDGKVAVVTGGGSGIGAALSQALARAGALVIVADIDEIKAQAVVQTITQCGGQAEARHVDVRDEESFCVLIHDLITRHEHVDYLFNNAGIAVTGEARDLTLAHWRRVIDVNLYGVVNGIQQVYPLMAARGQGHIINIASLAGLVPFPTNSPYAAAKHAVVGLSMSLRAEAADLGVKVSVVCPGFIESNIYQASEVVNVPRECMLANIPFRLVAADDAAQRILKGMVRNEAIMVFPGYARVLWWLYRMRATFATGIGLKMVRDLRKIRGQPA